jgi:hypothetical protein
MFRDDLASVMLKRRQGSEDQGTVEGLVPRSIASPFPVSRKGLGTLISLRSCLAPHPPTHLTTYTSLHYYIIINSSKHLVGLRHSMITVTSSWEVIHDEVTDQLLRHGEI